MKINFQSGASKILVAAIGVSAYAAGITILRRYEIGYYSEIFLPALIVATSLFIYREAPSLKMMFFGLLVGLILFLGLSFFSDLDVVENYERGVTYFDFLVGLLNVVVLVPAIEEKFVRGLLFDGMREVMSFPVVSFATSLFFAGYHGSNFIFALIFSLVMCFCMWKFKFGFYERLASHGVVNLLVAFWWFGAIGY